MRVAHPWYVMSLNRLIGNVIVDTFYANRLRKYCNKYLWTIIRRHSYVESCYDINCKTTDAVIGGLLHRLNVNKAC